MWRRRERPILSRIITCPVCAVEDSARLNEPANVWYCFNCSERGAWLTRTQAVTNEDGYLLGLVDVYADQSFALDLFPDAGEHWK